MGTWTRRLIPLLALVVGLLLLVSDLSMSGRSAALAADTLWVRQFGSTDHSAATDVAVDAAGSAVVVGWTIGGLPGQRAAGGPRDAFVARVDRNGTLSWVRQFGSGASDVAAAVAVDATGAVYVAGRTGGALAGQNPAGESDAFLRKYDPAGTELWTRQFGNARATIASGLAVDGAGSIYVVGATGAALPNQSAFGQNDAFLRKYDGSGNEVWTRQFGTPRHDQAIAVATDRASHVYVAGSTTAGPASVPFLRQFDAGSGNELSNREIGRAQIDAIAALTVDAAGQVYVVGRTGGDDPTAFVRKYSPAGAEIWARGTSAPHSHNGEAEVATDVIVDHTGLVFVLGHTNGDLHLPGRQPAGGFDTFVVMYSQDGTKLDTLSINTPGNDIASGLGRNEHGDTYAVGWTSRGFTGQQQRGRTDAFVTKLR